MKFRPLYNNLLVSRKKTEEKTLSGIVIPDVAQEKQNVAEVLAAGPGTPRQNKGGEWITVQDVKVGDMVLLGKYSGIDIELDGSPFTIIKSEDVLGVYDKTQS